MKKVLLGLLALVSVSGFSQEKTIDKIIDRVSSLELTSETKAVYVYDITDFGAVSGDDICDVSAIQAAIDSAYSTIVLNAQHQFYPGGHAGTVYIPQGAWTVDTSITLRSYITVEVEKTAMIRSTYQGPVYTTPGHNADGGACYAFGVTGGYYIGPRTTDTDSYGQDNSKLIYLKSDSDEGREGVSAGFFNDISAGQFDKAIHLENFNNGWSADIRFDNVYLDRCRVYVDNGNAGGNSFSNFTIQPSSTFDEDTLIIVTSINNSFTNTQVWDFRESDSIIAVYTSGLYNIFQIGGIHQSYCVDVGHENKFLTMSGAYFGDISSNDISDAAAPSNLNFNKKLSGDPTYDVPIYKRLGEIKFRGWHTDAFYTGATIDAYTNAATGAGDMPTMLRFQTSADGSATPVNRMLIYQDGTIELDTTILPITDADADLGTPTRGFRDLNLARNINQDAGGDYISAFLSTGTITAGTGITTAMLSRFMYHNTASAIDITANPQIADGSSGQVITIVGSSDTNTLTLDDGTGLFLSAQMVLGVGDAITLVFNATLDGWVEVSRSNN